LPPYTKTLRPFPRKHVRMLAGPPVQLADLVALPRTQQVINTATDRIMAAITELVAELRGEVAPATRFDPRKAGVRLTGDPRKQERRGERP
jgi:hypothetical protein